MPRGRDEREGEVHRRCHLLLYRCRGVGQKRSVSASRGLAPTVTTFALLLRRRRRLAFTGRAERAQGLSDPCHPPVVVVVVAYHGGHESTGRAKVDKDAMRNCAGDLRTRAARSPRWERSRLGFAPLRAPRKWRRPPCVGAEMGNARRRKAKKSWGSYGRGGCHCDGTASAW